MGTAMSTTQVKLRKTRYLDFVVSRFWSMSSLPPATKLGQGYIFTGVCHSVNRGVPIPGGWVPVPGGGSARGGVPGGDPTGTATDAGGTHPTGMNSCSILLLLFLVRIRIEEYGKSFKRHVLFLKWSSLKLHFAKCRKHYGRHCHCVRNICRFISYPEIEDSNLKCTL